MDYVHACEVYNSRVPLDFVDEQSMMDIGMMSAAPLARRAKRIMDLVLSSLALVFAGPLMLLIGLIIKISEPRASVVYTQDRVGAFGSVFKILKFRTMRPDAEEGTGAVWSHRDDERITRLGRGLRRSRLDELPQLLNILMGDMSIVGPRPERPEFVEELDRQIPFYRERSNVMPGLTGWAQIRYPYGGSVEDAAHKLEFDLYYIKHLSLSLDIQIMLSTLRIVVLGKEHQQ